MSQYKSKRIARRPRKTNITPIRLPKVPVSYEEAKALYNTPDYRAWREEVLKRDGYLCQMCGKSGQMEVHHIKPKRLFPELTLDHANGITLCKKCHQTIVTGREGAFCFIFSRIVRMNIRRNS